MDEVEKFNRATNCEICHVKFDTKDRLKIKNLDHDHYSGEYRRAACTMCNLLNRSQSHIPIYFHNFAKYDSKLLIQMLNEKSKMRVKPKFLFSNLQNVRYLTFNSYQFTDSLEHLPSSLSKLAKELNNEYQRHLFTIFSQSSLIRSYLTKNLGEDKIKEKYKLLTSGKGIYPYRLADYSNNMKKINCFPKIDMFFNHLTNTKCSTEDYEFGKKIWNEFNC